MMKLNASLLTAAASIALLANAQAAPQKTSRPARSETTSARLSEASQRIAQAVEAFKPLAGSGVEIYQVKPSKSAKQMLLQLALQEGIIESESDFELAKTDDAWEGDSSNWGLETMKGAYSYIMTLDPDTEKQLQEPENKKKKAKFEANLKVAKAAFPLLMNTGVQFGVVPLGAVQCGFRFAGLAILDTESGKIYVFSREASGC